MRRAASRSTGSAGSFGTALVRLSVMPSCRSRPRAVAAAPRALAASGRRGRARGAGGAAAARAARGSLRPGRVLAGARSAMSDEHSGSLNVVQCVDPVAERVVDGLGVVAEPVRGVAVRPAALLLERLRQVPVVEREPGQDARAEQFVDEPAVEVEPGLVDDAVARLDARPAGGEAVRVEAELLHERDVCGHPVVVVDGDLGGVAVRDAPGTRAKWSQIESSLPSSWAAPSICAAAVADPQRKPSGQRSSAMSVMPQPFTAPAMMPETSCLPASTKRMSRGMVASTAPASTIE